MEYKNHFTIGTKLSLRNTSYENNDESFVDENQTINERELNLMSIAINSQTFIKNHCNLRKRFTTYFLKGILMINENYISNKNQY